MGGGPAARALQGAARPLPGPLDRGRHGVPCRGRLLVGHHRRDVHAVSRDWQTYSSADGVTALNVFPLELTKAMFIGMDPPKHDRIKALFQAGFTPKRIADHEDEIRAIVLDVLDRLEGRESCDPRDRRRPARRLTRDRQLHGNSPGGRRDLGTADELIARGRRPGSEPRWSRRDAREGHPGDLRALRAS